jgi:hypothetical protein
MKSFKQFKINTHLKYYITKKAFKFFNQFVVILPSPNEAFVGASSSASAQATFKSIKFVLTFDRYQKISWLKLNDKLLITSDIITVAIIQHLE